MDWSEFQQTAERLAQGTTEGDWRSAISRAYYSAFHFFRGFLLTHGLNIGSGAQCHFNLYSGLLNCGFLAVVPIARRTDELRRQRAVADYELGRPVHQGFGVSMVQEGRNIIADFQALLATVPASQIASGAQKHLQAIGRLGRTP